MLPWCLVVSDTLVWYSSSLRFTVIEGDLICTERFWLCADGDRNALGETLLEVFSICCWLVQSAVGLLLGCTSSSDSSTRETGLSETFELVSCSLVCLPSSRTSSEPQHKHPPRQRSIALKYVAILKIPVVCPLYNNS